MLGLDRLEEAGPAELPPNLDALDEDRPVDEGEPDLIPRADAEAG